MIAPPDLPKLNPLSAKVYDLLVDRYHHNCRVYPKDIYPICLPKVFGKHCLQIADILEERETLFGIEKYRTREGSEYELVYLPTYDPTHADDRDDDPNAQYSALYRQVVLGESLSHKSPKILTVEQACSARWVYAHYLDCHKRGVRAQTIRSIERQYGISRTVVSRIRQLAMKSLLETTPWSDWRKVQGEEPLPTGTGLDFIKPRAGYHNEPT